MTWIVLLGRNCPSLEKKSQLLISAMQTQKPLNIELFMYFTWRVQRGNIIPYIYNNSGIIQDFKIFCFEDLFWILKRPVVSLQGSLTGLLSS